MANPVNIISDTTNPIEYAKKEKVFVLIFTNV